MATARSSQAHNKRVQQIAAEAAEKVAADSPLEEEVIVVVEELPPGESPRAQRGRTAKTPRSGEGVLGFAAQTQKSMETFGAWFDARHLTQETFRLAEGLLASQKEFALRVAEAMTRARAA